MDYDNKYSDRQYYSIVKDILNDEKFNEIKDITHHGLDRLGHSLRVSYYSYKITKFLGLNYKSTARAGLLHDFFYETNDDVDFMTRLETLVKHPKYALQNAEDMFELTDIEKDIIVSHMFPVAITLPKYLESWIVNFVDDFVAVSEACYSARTKVAYGFNFLLILMFTYLR